MRRVLVVALAFTASACAGGAVGSAVLNTAVAATAAGVRRANGECFTPCNPGFACNKSTGYCDPLPCRGECRQDERCESNYLGEKCVPAKDLPALTP
jgi:hypothetical protein